MAEYATPIKQQWHIDFNSKVVVHTIVFVVTVVLAALGHTWLNTSPLAVPNEALQNTLMHAAVSLWSVVFVAGVATTLFLPISETWKHPLLAGLVGLYQSILFGISLHGTPFGTFAYFYDQHFISASMVKYMTFHSLVDFNYQGLPAFYPPLYFYLTGKLAVLFGIDPNLCTEVWRWCIACHRPICTAVVLDEVCLRLEGNSYVVLFVYPVYIHNRSETI